MALYVKFHEEAELHPELNDEARVEFTKLEHHDEENIKLWRWFIDISLREYKKTYDQLGITFDSYKGESFYYDKVPAVVEELREKGLLKHDDGAEIVDLEKYGMPPCLILKKGRLVDISIPRYCRGDIQKKNIRFRQMYIRHLGGTVAALCAVVQGR